MSQPTRARERTYALITRDADGAPSLVAQVLGRDRSGCVPLAELLARGSDLGDRASHFVDDDHRRA